MEEKQLKEKIRHLQLANMCLDENNKYKQQKIDRAIEELELWNPKIEILKIERDVLIDILKGEDNE